MPLNDTEVLRELEKLRRRFDSSDETTLRALSGSFATMSEMVKETQKVNEGVQGIHQLLTNLNSPTSSGPRTAGGLSDPGIAQGLTDEIKQINKNLLAINESIAGATAIQFAGTAALIGITKNIPNIGTLAKLEIKELANRANQAFQRAGGAAKPTGGDQGGSEGGEATRKGGTVTINVKTLKDLIQLGGDVSSDQVSNLGYIGQGVSSLFNTFIELNTKEARLAGSSKKVSRMQLVKDAVEEIQKLKITESLGKMMTDLSASDLKTEQVVAIKSLNEILGVITGIQNISKEGFKSAIQMKLYLNTVRPGRMISTLLKDISKGVEEGAGFEFKAKMEGLDMAVGLLDKFNVGYIKNVARLEIASMFKPGDSLRGIVRDLNFELPGVPKDVAGGVEWINPNTGEIVTPDDDGLYRYQDEATGATRSVKPIKRKTNAATNWGQYFTQKLTIVEDAWKKMGHMGEKVQPAMKGVLLARTLSAAITVLVRGMSKEMNATSKDITQLYHDMKSNIIVDGKGKSKITIDPFTYITGVINRVATEIQWDDVKSAAKSAFIVKHLKFPYYLAEIIGGISASVAHLSGEASGENVERFEQSTNIASKGILKTMTILVWASKVGKSAEAGVVRVQTIITSLVTNLSDVVEPKKIKKVHDGIEMIHTMTKSVKDMVKDLTFVGTMGLVASPLIAFGIGVSHLVVASLSKLSTRDTKKTVKGGHQTMTEMVGAVRGSILGLIVSGTLGMLALPVIMAGLGVTALVVNLFQHMIRKDREIKKGGKAIAGMVAGVSFAIVGLIGIGVLAKHQMKNIMGGLAVVSGVALVFGIVGMAAGPIKKGAFSMAAIGLGLAVFSVGLAMYTLTVWAMEKAGVTQIGLLVLAGTALVFGITGVADKQVGKGALLVAAMGLALFIFGVGLEKYANVIKDWTWETAGISAAVLGGSAVLLGAIGLAIGKFPNGKQVFWGPALIAAIGAAYWVFGFGLEKVTAAIQGYTWEKVGMLGAILGGSAVVLGAIGLAVGSLGGTPFLGPALIAAIGLALVPYAKGLQEMGKAPVWDFDTIKSMGLTLGALVLGFSAAGLASLLVLPGAAAVAIMGDAMGSLGAGLTIAGRVNWKAFDMDSMKNVIVGLGEAFAQVGSENQGGGLLGYGLSMIGMGPNKVKKGIESVMEASRALGSVSEGVRKFFDFTSGLPAGSFAIDAEGKPSVGSLPHTISLVLGMINQAFGAIGSTATTGSTSLMKLVFGNDFRPSDTEVGIESVMKSGKALHSVADGIAVFASKTESLASAGGFAVDASGAPAIGSIPHRATVILGMLNAAFSAIGGSGNSGTSVMKFVFGNDFKKSDTEVGIKSVLDTGKALTSVTDGIISFSRLLEKENIILDSNNPNAIQHKIQAVVSVIAAAFADLGQGERGSGAKSLFGISLTEGDVQKGIDTAIGLGPVIGDIADGLMKFADLQKAFPGLDIEKGKDSKVIGNMVKIVSIIGAAFAGLAQDGSEFSLGILGFEIFSAEDKNAVKRGIESVEGIGDVLTGIAEGIKVFAELEKLGIKKDAFNAGVQGSIANNIVSIISVIGTAFGSIGAKTKLAQITNRDGTVTSVQVPDDSVAKGIQSIKGLGEELEGIAGGVKVFADLTAPGKKLDLKKIGGAIYSVITAVSSAFGQIGGTVIPGTSPDGKQVFYMNDAVKRGVEAMSGSGDILEKIANGLKPFMDMQTTKGFKMDTLRKNITDVITLVSSEVARIGSDPKFDSSSDDSPMKKGAQSLTTASEAMENVVKFAEKLKNMQTDQWEKQRVMLSQMSTAPIEAIKMAADVYSQAGGESVINNVIDNVFPKVEHHLLALSNVWKIVGANVSKDDGGKSPIGILAKDIVHFISSIKLDVKPIHLQNMDTMVRYMERMANIASPLGLMQKSFREFVKDTGDLVKHVNGIQTSQFKAFNEVQDRVIEIVKVSSSQLRGNVDALNSYLDKVKSTGQPPTPQPFGSLDQLAMALQAAQSITHASASIAGVIASAQALAAPAPGTPSSTGTPLASGTGDPSGATKMTDNSWQVNDNMSVAAILNAIDENFRIGVYQVRTKES